MISHTISLTELTTTTLQLLCREIGVVNTARFLNQFTMGTGNYTAERAQFLDDDTVDTLVAEIQRRRTKPRA